ncbi:DUF982 domain-containing protein [Mesorhizobium sp. M0768]
MAHWRNWAPHPAAMACMKVLGGDKAPEIARVAFLSATKEAKILNA